ncbi:MAG: hypothetical protein DWQ07_20190 [Chloroflexi bacterium]|nr:MAG: hypothetical protein DWQ07_20190 [Chloroflexota bacterium]MBL1194402.1 hypothetical protein [Chloroflexota bacterium]NOH11690.1 hypothetical protein [Chloroflexota bacterium]
MRDNNPALLEHAERLIKGRLYEEARQLLASYLRTHRNSDLGWYLMSYTLTDREERIRCLERALDIYPYNMDAQERLDKLKIGGSKTQTIPPFILDE